MTSFEQTSTGSFTAVRSAFGRGRHNALTRMERLEARMLKKYGTTRTGRLKATFAMAAIYVGCFVAAFLMLVGLITVLNSLVGSSPAPAAAKAQLVNPPASSATANSVPPASLPKASDKTNQVASSPLPPATVCRTVHATDALNRITGEWLYTSNGGSTFVSQHVMSDSRVTNIDANDVVQLSLNSDGAVSSVQVVTAMRPNYSDCSYVNAQFGYSPYGK